MLLPLMLIYDYYYCMIYILLWYSVCSITSKLNELCSCVMNVFIPICVCRQQHTAWVREVTVNEKRYLDSDNESSSLKRIQNTRSPMFGVCDGLTPYPYKKIFRFSYLALDIRHIFDNDLTSKKWIQNAFVYALHALYIK